MVNSALLVGKWQALIEPAPDIILDKKNYFMLLRGSTDTDTLNFTYTLNHRVIIIYWGKQWMSKNNVIKLTNDSLIYQRKGDKRIFKFKRV